MTLFPLTDCCERLSVDPKTLRQWIKHAAMSLHAHPTDARVKCLTLPQVQQLARSHGRTLQPHPVPPLGSEASTSVWGATAAHIASMPLRSRPAAAAGLAASPGRVATAAAGSSHLC